MATNILQFSATLSLGFYLTYTMKETTFLSVRRNIYLPLKEESKKEGDDYSWSRIFSKLGSGLTKSYHDYWK